MTFQPPQLSSPFDPYLWLRYFITFVAFMFFVIGVVMATLYVSLSSVYHLTYNLVLFHLIM